VEDKGRREVMGGRGQEGKGRRGKGRGSPFNANFWNHPCGASFI